MPLEHFSRKSEKVVSSIQDSSSLEFKDQLLSIIFYNQEFLVYKM